MAGRWSPLRTLLSSAAPWRKPSPRPYHTIEAVPRERTGSKRSARDRAMGRIPTLVSDGTSGSSGRKLLLTTSEDQIRSLAEDASSFCSTTYPLLIRAGVGSSHVLDSGTIHPIKVYKNEEGKILNLIFEWAESGSNLKVDVPILYKGEDICPGLLKGGCLQKIKTTLKCLCPVEHMPPKIEVDLANADIGDVILSNDITMHPSLKLFINKDPTPICKIVAAKPN